jgi:hypothetical protein
MNELKPIPVQFGRTESADFELQTWTLEMSHSNFIVAAGEVAVLPFALYEELLKSAKKVAYSNGFDAAYPDNLEALRAAIAKAGGAT